MQDQQILNQMVALSEKKLEMLIRLKGLSEKQNKAFYTHKLDSIEQILSKKDEIIQYIHQLDDAFLMASDNLKEMLDIKSLEDLSNSSLNGRNELKELIRNITDTVESIILVEKDSYNSAKGIQKDLANKIKDVNAGRKITTAYNFKPSNNPSYFFDKKK